MPKWVPPASAQFQANIQTPRCPFWSWHGSGWIFRAWSEKDAPKGEIRFSENCWPIPALELTIWFLYWGDLEPRSSSPRDRWGNASEAACEARNKTMQILWTSFKGVMIFLPAKKVLKIDYHHDHDPSPSCFLVFPPLKVILSTRSKVFGSVPKRSDWLFLHSMEVDYPYIYDRHPICSLSLAVSFEYWWMLHCGYTQPIFLARGQKDSLTRLWAPQDL